MKFLKKQQDEINQSIELSGHLQEDFQFVKRKGRIRILYKNDGKVFSYFRTRSNNDIGKFEDSDHYLISQDGSKEQRVENWMGVMIGMREWLDGLLKEKSLNS